MSRRIAILAGLVLLVAVPAWSQTQITTGVIQGTVSDQSGALVPGALVEARNVDTNSARAQTTLADGRFVFLQLRPGRYTLTVTLAGFATHVQQDVTVTVGQSVTVNPVLKVSGAAETVTVTGSSLIDITRTEVSNTLDETIVSTTPILGRKFEDLLTLTPGVSIVQGPDGDEITFSGQRGMYNNVSLDGGDYNNGFFGEQLGGQRAAIDITLEAVKEFQVIANGANAEFGRTASGVVNVITKSGTNEINGSLFHFQRLEGLTADASDGTPPTDFHREQFGGTLGGPIKRDRLFYFVALEHINENLQRANLSRSLGTCGVAAPVITNPAHETLINGSTECQRLALLDFFRTTRGQEEGNPIDHKIDNTAILGKVDAALNPSNNLSASYNFDYSSNDNQTFDVATYGNSANGIEGPSKIGVLNLNFFTTLSASKFNEFHVTYARELRPRNAVESNVPPDTGMGDPAFRFGNPYFLHPSVDELLWRTQIKDNLSIVKGPHTFKVGGEWLHTVNDQTFRGFFEGRYLFATVSGFLRYASPAAPGGFGPNAVGCSDGTWVTSPAPCPAGTTLTGTPLLLYLQETGSGYPGVDPPGYSLLVNEDLALFAQDQWQVRSNVTINYGLRWDAQLMADTVDPATTAYASLVNNPAFLSKGDIPNQLAQLQPRFGIAWNVRSNGETVVRANAGLYYARNNMLSQAGSVTANGLQNQGAARGAVTGLVPGVAPMPTWPGILEIAPLPPGQFPLFTNVRTTAADYRNPKIGTVNVALEQTVAPDVSLYFDFTWSKGVDLSQFLNINTPGRGSPFSPQLGDVFVHTSLAHSLYRGATFAIRKRFSRGYQLEANYVLSNDKDTDSSERDPFTDRSFDLPLDQLDRLYAPSDRDSRHKFNLVTYGNLPAGMTGNVRIQARSAQPITPTGGGPDQRNSARKDNEFFTFDWRIMRPFKFGNRYQLIPTFEMFNTFNNANNINPLVTPALFNFDGFLRLGVGDPRQVQLAVKLLF
ncbi:MAG TPA: carboxypeptidase regulatory-like domain-containing protein [Vicinamibacterales bacterium]|nr:carboxypeptidase regulatory-like domain-containing protein [Vicinamibacterales bacterium]